ncbi:MAG: transcriptional regulator [Haloplasmataceae bacterium]|jgi:Fur family ferric uptake transcriptional regulator|nr:transcriptional regulator [Haloplasmataceae bacterium]
MRENDLERYIDKIKQMHAKITPQRIEILKIFLSNQEDHLTTEEIISRLSDSKTGQATVYRTLELFCQAGILKKVNFKNEDFARYDLLDLDSKHFHHHFICTQCEKVIEINEDLLEPIEEQIQKEHHLVITNHELIFRGICQDCQNKSDINE